MRTDWGALMRVGLGALGLPPEVFWSMTPREFRAAVEGRFGRAEARMRRDRLMALMAAHPDEGDGNGRRS